MDDGPLVLLLGGKSGDIRNAGSPIAWHVKRS